MIQDQSFSKCLLSLKQCCWSLCFQSDSNCTHCTTCRSLCDKSVTKCTNCTTLCTLYNLWIPSVPISFKLYKLYKTVHTVQPVGSPVVCAVVRKLKEDSNILYSLKSQRMIRNYSNKHFSPFTWNIGVQPECIDFFIDFLILILILYCLFYFANIPALVIMESTPLEQLLEKEKSL